MCWRTTLRQISSCLIIAVAQLLWRASGHSSTWFGKILLARSKLSFQGIVLRKINCSQPGAAHFRELRSRDALKARSKKGARPQRLITLALKFRHLDFHRVVAADDHMQAPAHNHVRDARRLRDQVNGGG